MALIWAPLALALSERVREWGERGSVNLATRGYVGAELNLPHAQALGAPRALASASDTNGTSGVSTQELLELIKLVEDGGDKSWLLTSAVSILTMQCGFAMLGK